MCACECVLGCAYIYVCLCMFMHKHNPKIHCLKRYIVAPRPHAALALLAFTPSIRLSSASSSCTETSSGYQTRRGMRAGEPPRLDVTRTSARDVPTACEEETTTPQPPAPLSSDRAAELPPSIAQLNVEVRRCSSRKIWTDLVELRYSIFVLAAREQRERSRPRTC